MGGIVRAAGQIAAFAIGTAINPIYGGAIANTLFNVLVPPPQASLGSTRLEDLLREGAEIGSPIKKFYGVMPTKGDVIDCGVDKKGVPAGIEEVVKKKKQKGGTGGGSKQTTKEYSYFLTAAYLLGEGVLFVEQMKAEDNDGERVVYDRHENIGEEENQTPLFKNPRDLISHLRFQKYLKDTQQNVVVHKGGKALNDGDTFTLTPQYIGGELVAELSQKLRFYLGTERQPLDTRLAQIHGDKAIPYRGEAYVMFNRWKINGTTTFTFIVRDLETNRRRIIRKRFVACGVPENRIALNSIDSDLHGAVIAQVEPVRDLCEKIAATRFHDLHFINGGFRDVSRANPYQWTLTENDLGARVVSDGNGEGSKEGDAPSRAQINHKTPRELPTVLRIRFVDVDLNYEFNEAVAQRGGANHENETTMEVPFAARLDEMVWLADAILDELWAAVGSERFALLPTHARIAPGNVIHFPYKGQMHTVRVTSQALAPRGVLEQNAVPYDGGVYGQHRVVSLPDPPPSQIDSYGTPIVFMADLPPFNDAMRASAGFVWGATVDKTKAWGGAQILSNDVTGFGDSLAEARAVIGELLTAYSYVEVDMYRLNMSHTLRMKLLGGGTLLSTTIQDLENGANRLALGELIISFFTATPVVGQIDTYDLSGILPGRNGTDWKKSVPIGTRTLKLTDETGEVEAGVEFAPVALGKILAPRDLEVVSALDVSRTLGVSQFSVSGNSLKPPRILHMTKTDYLAGGYSVTILPRSRDFQARYFDNGLQTGETDPRRITIQLKNGATVVDSRTIDSLSLPIVVNYTQAQLQSWFGGVVPEMLSGSVWHEGATMRGHERIFTI